MDKTKLSHEGQIDYMSDKKGIKFNVITKEEAIHYLKEHNYFFKLKSYAKNYEKWETGESAGKYKGLEFAYLQELSIIDMHLRRIILLMCLNLEHSLRHKIVNICTSNKSDDGYEIVEEYYNFYPNKKEKIENKSRNSITNDLFLRYGPKPALWNIIELLDFKELTDFMEYYSLAYPHYKLENFYPFNVKFLRNAAAHNNCIINNLKKSPSRSENTITQMKLTKYVSNITSIKRESRKRNLSNPVIHDFVCLLVMYDEYVKSEKIRSSDFNELKSLFHNRMLKNRHFFENNPSIKSSYDFSVKVVDFISSR